MLLDRTPHLLRINILVPLRTRDRAMLVGVGLDQARIDRKAFTPDQAGRNARAHDTFEHAPEDGAIAEALVARTREHRMIRDLVLDREPTKPTIRKVHLHLKAQCSLRTDRKYIANDEHPDHQHRIDRGPAN